MLSDGGHGVAQSPCQPPGPPEERQTSPFFLARVPESPARGSGRPGPTVACSPARQRLDTLFIVTDSRPCLQFADKAGEVKGLPAVPSAQAR